jgi:hypothetical protein
MASVAFVTTEHDEADLSPAKLPQHPGQFPGRRADNTGPANGILNSKSDSAATGFGTLVLR